MPSTHPGLHLTIFAGPNGSGKSTLTRIFQEKGEDLGAYINADDIRAGLEQAAASAGTTPSTEALDRQAFHQARARRFACIAERVSFSFETVFSHESNLESIISAKAAGYAVTLIFVTTENSRVNVERVAKRVREGGHDVPRDKIINRYRRSMALLPPASMVADETILYDTTQDKPRLVARLRWDDDQGEAHIRIFDPMPEWLKVSLQEISDLIPLRRSPDKASP